MAVPPEADDSITERPSTPASGLVGHLPPRFRRGVKVVASRGDRILLIKEARFDGSTFWTLPGGGLRRFEDPVEGLRREVSEELRCTADVHGPVAQCTYRHRTRPDTVTLYTVFQGTVHGEPRPNAEEGVIDYAWTAPPGPDGTLDPFRRVIRTAAGRPVGSR